MKKANIKFYLLGCTLALFFLWYIPVFLTKGCYFSQFNFKNFSGEKEISWWDSFFVDYFYISSDSTTYTMHSGGEKHSFSRTQHNEYFVGSFMTDDCLNGFTPYIDTFWQQDSNTILLLRTYRCEGACQNFIRLECYSNQLKISYYFLKKEKPFSTIRQMYLQHYNYKSFFGEPIVIDWQILDKTLQCSVTKKGNKKTVPIKKQITSIIELLFVCPP